MDDPIGKNRAALNEAIGDFIVEWAQVEGTLHRMNKTMAQTNRLYNERYGTALQDVPDEDSLSDDAKFKRDRDRFKKIAATAVTGSEDKIKSIEEGLNRIYDARNDIAHRTEFLNPVINPPTVCCSPRAVPKEVKTALPWYHSPDIVYTLDNVRMLAREARALNVLIRSFFGAQISQIMKDNNLTPEEIEERNFSRRKPRSE
ncbi:hypothetical protein [Sinorhizobium americanum]|uniref:hypothetical protein n=1 Tax=Sinorhizobium americanum TaxID=194963 RepID=UPI0007D90574|nr:hypothetical protein [Sinorhizobium americanum]OAP43743.1 hypothetical protein ATC00_02565 [Sinorhizobium americanum]